MEKTPLAMRKHVTIFGNTNVGKSTLFNSLLGQEIAIVSEVEGTTTDPVIKAWELIPYGPIALIDTAGLSDESQLGQMRIKKTMNVLKRTDLILHVLDAESAAGTEIAQVDKSIPEILVLTKCDETDEATLSALKDKYPDAVFLFGYKDDDLRPLRVKMIDELDKQDRDDETMIGKFLPKGSSLILVCPIDSEAPKGRLILPQVQLIRDCLDHNMKAYVTTEHTLLEALEELKKVDLVVTDSQAFKLVDSIVPKEIPLTSFSMLLACQKSDFETLIAGAGAVDKLTADSKILMLEGCTHNTSHEDIGRVKIPRLIKKYTGYDLEFKYYTGYNFPEDLSGYSLCIQCGMCMVNKKEIQSRLDAAKKAGLPVTNYGMVLAKLNGILDRAKEIFYQEV